MMYLPQRSIIISITQDVQATVTLDTVTGLSIGQFVRFIIPLWAGMQQLTGNSGKILFVDPDDLTILVDVNTVGMDPFNASSPPYNFSPPQLIPFGDGLDPTMPYQTSATLNGLTHNVLL